MPNELYESKDPGSGSSPGVRVPIPDPTLLTTVQLNREISAVKDLIHALKEIVFTRLDVSFLLAEAGRGEVTPGEAEKLGRL